jgi:hypothetical protein
MTALLLRRRRETRGRSLREIATRLGASSRNSYARYERGEAVPTVEKLDALLKATSPHPLILMRRERCNHYGGGGKGVHQSHVLPAVHRCASRSLSSNSIRFPNGSDTKMRS